MPSASPPESVEPRRPAGRHGLVYVAASGALLAGIGLGSLMSGGATGSADAYRAVRLAHAHLNLLGWVGLAVLGTQFTLWPTVLRTRMVPGLPAVVNAVFLLTVSGLGGATTRLRSQPSGPALAGPAGYAAWLAAALVPFVRTLAGRPRTGRRRGCWRPAPPGSRSPWSLTWPPCSAATGWSSSMAASAGSSRP
jgi:hypothetical protein